MILGEGEPAAGPWRAEPITGLAARLLQCAGRPAGRPRVIAVDGRSGSGKTTLSERISAVISASAVVHTDDVAWHHSFFGWDGLMIAGVLEPVHRGEAVSFRPPAWQERSRAGAVRVPAGCPLVIVEGVGAARRELMPFTDAAVWVQSDMAEAKRRCIDREGGDEAAASFWDEWMAQELPFLSRQRPWERADVIVAGTPELPHDPATEILAARPGGGGQQGHSATGRRGQGTSGLPAGRGIRTAVRPAAEELPRHYTVPSDRPEDRPARAGTLPDRPRPPRRS
jgi:hypothetical protein